jgi:hypothetical protein
MKSPDMKSPDPARKRRLFTWGALRRIVIGLAWTATLIALAYGVEDWRGRRAWEQYHAAAEARGEHLDLSYFIPKPIPDDQNFAMAGSFPTTLFQFDDIGARGEEDMHKVFKGFNWSDRFSVAMKNVDFRRSVFDSHQFHWTDLATWEKALVSGSTSDFRLNLDPDPAARVAAAPGVLRGLQDSAGVLDELRAASSRPKARFPVEYDAENPAMIALPHYSVLQNACQHLRLRASAELALGRSDDAMQDLKLIFYLSESPRDEPFLIAGLVRVGLLALQSQLIWEGLAGHDWSDAQLAEIQQSLLSRNYVADIDRELAAQRATSVAVVEYYRSRSGFDAFIRDTGWFEGISTNLGMAGAILIKLMPRGWYYLEQINVAESFNAWFQSVFDPVAKRVFPRRLDANLTAERQSLPAGQSMALIEQRFMEQSWFSFVGDAGLIRRFAAAQCMANQGAIACGLERYRLAKGAYPTTLEALVPAFIPALPHDVLTGGPYLYRRERADIFVLYSIGWDLQDHGGNSGIRPYGPDGDWVWQ